MENHEVLFFPANLAFLSDLLVCFISLDTEDYLPLIAGLIAVIVAFISVIFIFIFSIYYKTAKMGHYSLKDAKPSAQNGNIAQNGKHNPIPMKKLSQSNILA